jgi:hypothetical protein
MSDVIYGTQAELDAALAYWQDVLNLRDWKVKATVSPRREMEEAGRDGECRVDEPARFARIWILHPEDRLADAVFHQDHEEVLVHELLHIFFNPLNEMDDERISVHIEQSINAIAEGLVRLKRGKESNAGRFAERFMRKHAVAFRELAGR